MKAVLIHPERDWYVIGHPDDEHGQYQATRLAVDTTIIERVPFQLSGHSLEAWVDVDGLLRRLPYNPVASWLAFGPSLDGILVGRALITARDMAPLDDEQVSIITSALEAGQ